MPQNWSKHKEELELVIGPEEFATGMNNTAVPSEFPLLWENMYFDYSSGRPRTRWPFRRYSTTSPDNSKVNGIYYWDSTLFFSCNSRLYYLDSTPAYVVLDDIGTEPPSFLPFHNYLQIASGIGLQEVSTSTVLTTVTGTGMPTTVKQLYEQNTKLWAIGNSSYPNYIHGSKVNDETTWSGTGTTYYELGQSNDEAPLIGLSKGPNGTIVCFKKGDQQKYTGFLDPNESSPVWRVVSNNESAHTFRGSTYVTNFLWIMDSFCPMAITGTDAVEKLVIDPNSLLIGSRIASSWNMSTDGFCVNYPPHAQIWFFPDPSTSPYIWVLHYNTMAWVKFTLPGDLRFYSAFYLPSTKVLYLGGNDGYIYTYDTTGTGNYCDNPGGTDTNITQRFVSKIYDIFPLHNHELKSPQFIYRGLKDGAGTFQMFSNYGANQIFNESFTISLSYPRLYEWRATYLYDLRTTRLWASQMFADFSDLNREADNFLIWLEITSGALEIREFKMNVARQTKK